MFFANSRSRIKSRPPKILISCLKFVCLIVFLILLIAQLRAIELPAAGGQGDRRDGQLGKSIVQYNETTRNETSIDRIDSSSTDDNQPSGSAPTISVDKVAQSEQASHEHELVVDNQVESPVADLSNGTNLSIQQDFSSSHGDDLLVSPATDQVQTSAPNEELPPPSPPVTSSLSEGSNLGASPQDPQHALPSLAEMTAAGTAAGLLVHDLLAQANVEDQAASNRANENLEPEGDAELTSQMQQMMANDQQQMPDQGDNLDDENGSRDSSPNDVSQLALSQDNPQPLVRAEAVHRPDSAVGVESSEPSSEEASPDSIESLIGPEAADLGTNDEGQEQSDADGQSYQQQQADSNLINSNQAANLIMPQAQPLASSDVDDDDDDLDGDDGGGADHAQGTQLRANHVAQGVPALTYDHYDQRIDDVGKFGPQAEQNLVAPMRDSLVDLNTAAGHYYGKKKKKKVKKVKKVIIKKKKKKKKKKYKKIKIIKIKKKKKVKKKGKKKHYPQHHHHDHGKYYMYAKVPKKKAWEFGFKKGNKKHWIERHEKGYKNKFKTKVKWYDKKSKGKGVHIWDYNHHDKKKKKHH